MGDRTASRALAVMLAAVPLVSGAFVLLLSLLFGVLGQCDESCTGTDWHHTAGAWQWLVFPALGGIVFLAGLMTFVYVSRRRPGSAFVATVVGTVAFFSGLAWSGHNWHQSLGRHPLIVGLIAVIVISGVLAALLGAPTEQDRGLTPQGSDPSHAP